MTQLIEKDERFELNKTASVESDQNSVIFFCPVHYVLTIKL